MFRGLGFCSLQELKVLAVATLSERPVATDSKVAKKGKITHLRV